MIDNIEHSHRHEFQNVSALFELKARVRELESIYADSSVYRNGWVLPPTPHSRLSNALWSWYMGENISVVVLGCSSTAGAGSNNDYFNYSYTAKRVRSENSARTPQIGYENVYFGALGKRMASWPRAFKATARFLNAAHGGTTTFWQSLLMDSIVGDHADILFWEFALTDTQFPTHSPHGTLVSHSASIDLFLKHAAELRSKPAVVLVYFWDRAKWPMKVTTWEQHQESVERFRDRGMDITVLLGGEMALNITRDHLNITNMSNGKAQRQLWSTTMHNGLDHHPSLWTHEAIADALELAFADTVLARAKDHTQNMHHIDSISYFLKRHSDVSLHYRPPIDQLASYSVDGGLWRWAANMTTSLTSMTPQYGQSRNGAHAYFDTEVEEGSKESAQRLDRKLDEVIYPCGSDKHQQYSAYFGIPPPGLSWKAVELSLLNCFQSTNPDLVLTISRKNASDLVIRRSLSCKIPNVWWKCVKVFSVMLDFESDPSLNNQSDVNGAADWTKALHFTACTDERDTSAPKGHMSLRWVLAYAGDSMNNL